ncbi:MULTISPECIES: DedA family protein [unclassified Gilliamella]|uniref:DedA family protein n=1 Tax=unclassified Gilliamella TaxID=2685620 RepID=UPI002269A547|nr:MULTISPECIES: DedA family protein [unclassified Gilliamella]MCX8573568.1 DedA family protein [Gilliamella sp. B3831]MCX8575804.1 DedA family protein [Gilliamella sp. B3815]MCX8590005.1 DedA family protein [Gilliamella sp. B3812]MCX8602906.1 DedA family protein [Gilliamella sp. B3823]MCX8605203.1 DedA family protein [Gilliamella sp. B3825]
MSLNEISHTIMQFIENHQIWALPIIFLLAFGESLAIISLVVPATAILLGVGALIGTGTLAFVPVLIAASLGAILGDLISYWLGKHYHHQVIHSWPLKKYPKLVFRAEQFFQRYGALGVFIGRFFGPLRAVVPLVAGAMHMPTTKFNLANITSAPIWAFVLLAPGAFGVPWLETLFG